MGQPSSCRIFGWQQVISVKKIILLADMESFYASVEIANNPSLQGKPVVVCGDPERRHGIVLAASREAKASGIKTGMPAWECKSLCPQAIFTKPHMQKYIDVSLQITGIFEQFTDRIFTYSIDEQFLDMTGCDKLFGSPGEMAAQISKKVLSKTGVRCRIGIGENLLQAKMACDRFAKKNAAGIFELNYVNYTQHTWPLPIKDLFGVGSRMEKKFHQLGVLTIGQLARLPRENLRKRWGINGEVLWLNAHGIDYSTISPSLEAASAEEHQGVGHSMTLPRDYADQQELAAVLLELTEEVCRRTRALDKLGQVVSLSCRGADFDYPTGFARQKKLAEPTAVTWDVYPVVLELFHLHWDRLPVRAIGLGLSGLIANSPYQLSFFDNKEKKLALSRTIDNLRQRFGPTCIFRASSLTPGAQFFARATKIGGHEA
jgi:DNA polymerase-4